MILYYGFNDKRTSLLAKIPAVLSVLYLLSPIDLIPDFIPFFGYADDLVIVPLLLNLSIRLLPGAVKQESIAKAGRNQRKLRWILALIIVLILGFLTGIFFLIRHFMRSGTVF